MRKYFSECTGVTINNIANISKTSKLKLCAFFLHGRPQIKIKGGARCWNTPALLRLCHFKKM